VKHTGNDLVDYAALSFGRCPSVVRLSSVCPSYTRQLEIPAIEIPNISFSFQFAILL